MTRIQRLAALASFVVAVGIVLALVSFAGGFGPVELLLAAIIAVPVTGGGSTASSIAS